MEEFVKQVIRGLEKEADENAGIVEVTNWIYNFTFSVIGALGLGMDFNGLRTREPHKYVTLAYKFFKSNDMVRPQTIFLMLVFVPHMGCKVQVLPPVQYLVL